MEKFLRPIPAHIFILFKLRIFTRYIQKYYRENTYIGNCYIYFDAKTKILCEAVA